MARKNRFRGFAFAAGVTSILVTPDALAAEDIQDQGVIRSTIEAAISSRFAANHTGAANVDVGNIDSRLRLPACPNINVDLPPTNAAMITAKVSCDTPSWTLYVPVRMHLWVDAVVAATNLAPNTVLTASQLTRGKVDAFANNAGVITDTREVTGKILRSGLAAGSPILSPALELPVSVRRGQKVVLTLTDPGMTIKATAVALEDGRVGDNISVQNAESQKTLRATVGRDGGVEINF